MQINPQVNTNIIRSVTLQHCPRGMCEFHLEISQTGDNSDNRGPSDIPPPIKLAKKIKQIQIQKSKAEADKSQGSQTVSEAWPGQISLEPSKPLGQTNINFFLSSNTTSCEFLHIHWTQRAVNTKIYANEWEASRFLFFTWMSSKKRKGKLEWDGDGTVTNHAYNLKESEMFHIVVVT